MREATVGLSASHPPLEEEVASDDKPIQEVEGYTEANEEEGVARPQGAEADLPSETQSARTRSSTNTRASTCGTRYVCRDWVSRIFVKRLKFVSRQFYLSDVIHQPCFDERPHLPPPGMMAFSEVIMRGRGSLPLPSFIIGVFKYFNVTPFQFTTNFFHTMVVFYIAFMEVGIGGPSVVEFTYVYRIKALARNVGFWYTTKRGPDVDGI